MQVQSPGLDISNNLQNISIRPNDEIFSCQTPKNCAYEIGQKIKATKINRETKNSSFAVVLTVMFGEQQRNKKKGIFFFIFTILNYYEVQKMYKDLNQIKS